MSNLPFSLPNLPWKWIGVGLAALALVAAVVFSIKAYGNARYEAGILEERTIWETAVAEAERKQAEAQRKADQNLAGQKAEDERRIAEGRQEIENAVSDIPDQGTSARQRARACHELRRQGEAPAACAVDAAR
jgi:hypothetical protein